VAEQQRLATVRLKVSMIPVAPCSGSRNGGADRDSSPGDLLRRSGFTGLWFRTWALRSAVTASTVREARDRQQITAADLPASTNRSKPASASSSGPIPASNDFRLTTSPRRAEKNSRPWGPSASARPPTSPIHAGGTFQCPAALASSFAATQGLVYLSQRNFHRLKPRKLPLTGTVSTPAELGLPFLSRSPSGNASVVGALACDQPPRRTQAVLRLLLLGYGSAHLGILECSRRPGGGGADRDGAGFRPGIGGCRHKSEKSPPLLRRRFWLALRRPGLGWARAVEPGRKAEQVFAPQLPIWRSLSAVRA